MKYVLLFKKTSTVKASGKGPRADAQRLHDYIAHYLDETGKPGASEAIEIKLKNPRAQKKHGTAQRAKKTEPLKKGIGYLTKEELGRIYVRGFLAREVAAATGRPLESLTNQEKADAVETLWASRLKAKNLTKMAHKIVISLDPAVSNEMTEKKIPVDELLYGAVDETMRQYCHRFYAGDEIGYLVGLHHDRKHIHAHILLYPQTASGRPLNVSHWSNVKRPDGTVGRVDYQGFIKETVERLGIELYNEKVKGKPGPMPMPESYSIQERLLTQAAVALQKAAAPDRSVDDVFWKGVVEKRADLEKLPPTALQRTITNEYRRRDIDFKKLSLEDAPISLNAAFPQRLIQRGTDLNLKRSEAWKERATLRSDAFRARGMLLGWRKIKWGDPFFSKTDEGSWWERRAAKNDALGVMMRQAQRETVEKFPHLDRMKGLLGPQYAFLRKREIMQRQAAEMAQLARRREAQLAEEMATLRKQQADRRLLLHQHRVRAHMTDLQILDAQAKLRGRVPRYLRDYRYHVNDNLPIAVSLSGISHQKFLEPQLREEGRKKFVEKSAPITPAEVAAPSENVATAPAQAGVVLSSEVSDSAEQVVEQPEQVFITQVNKGSGATGPVIDLTATPRAILEKKAEVIVDEEALKELGIDLSH